MRSTLTLLVIITLLAGGACQPMGPSAVQQHRQTSATPPLSSAADTNEEIQAVLDAHYKKSEHRIPMRDGVRLFTAVYAPTDSTEPLPILLVRTPYSVGPYGAEIDANLFRWSKPFVHERYIFAFQDVRGRFMSEGTYVNMRPHVADKRGPDQIDESSDTYDTIDWLVNNVPKNNGKVGLRGISYPGFYCSAGMIDAHPALAAVSPQAPIADWYFDDFYHHGALFLPHNFGFFAAFGDPRPALTDSWGGSFDYGTPDGYQFFLDMGPVKNADARYLHGCSGFWNEIVAHPAYDEFWQARNILPHLRNIAPAVMVVGGWYDAEDLYGALNTYQAVERQNPGVANTLVMGPWRHGGWWRTDGDRFGCIRFDAKTAEHYQKHVEVPFFNHYLKGEGALVLPEAYVFETGANRWRGFDHWPPSEAKRTSVYFAAKGALSSSPPTEDEPAYDEYVSDPAHPVPYTEDVSTRMVAEYMVADQRFSARRPDVLTYQTAPLAADLTVAGPILADLWVSTSGTDSDWIVKVIDVYPPNAPDPDDMPAGRHMGGYQMLVRSEVFRGRYRNSYERPEPFTPDEPARVKVPLQDVMHTFRRGHRLMVQVQSTWFPLVDRNPQKYVENIFEADEEDFVSARQRLHRDAEHASRIEIRVMGDPPF